MNTEILISWYVIIADLKHQLNGPASGSIIKSQATNKEWRVEERILFHHAMENQKRFPNETTTYTHGVFGSAEKMLNSAKNILDNEEQNIFHYKLEPIGHTSKPDAGDILIQII